MLLKQTWVGYVDRSYEQIKRSLLNRLGVLTPEISDHSESNPFIILISLFAGVAEVIHLYLDAMARESFLGTARRFSSVVKLVRLIDYDIKARVGATVNLLFTLTDNAGVATTYTNDIFIAKDTLVFPLNSTVPFRTIEDRFIPLGLSSVFVPAEQITKLTNQNLGTTSASSTPNQKFPLSSKYVHGSLSIVINGITWDLFNSFGFMDASTKGFVVQIDESQDAYLVFGDGTNGQIPPISQNIIASYSETEGAVGNLAPGLISQIQSTIVIPTGKLIKVTNPDYSSNGTNFESVEEIRDRGPRSIRTLQRAVTYQDYIDLAMLVPGVGAAEVQYCCGKYVSVYVVPNSKGVATLALVNKVKQFMDCKVMLTTQLDVKPAGVTRVWVKAKIIGNPLFNETEIRAQVLNKWDDVFGYGNLRINRRVSITDIIAETEALSKVDTIEIEQVRVEPYARPSDDTNSILNISWGLLPHTTQTYPYKLIYKEATTNFELYKNGLFLTHITIGAPYTEGSLVSFTIAAGSYSDGDTWEFSIAPSYPEIFPDTLIEIKDFSAPVIDISPFISDDFERTIFGDLTFEETSSSASCLPPC